MSSMALLQTKDKVQRYLAELINNLGIDADGDFHFRHGSARIFIRVMEWSNDETIVRVWAQTNAGVPASPDVYRFLALEGAKFVFGRIDAAEKDGFLNIYFAHTLLGSYLDPEELKTAAVLVAKTADEIDNQIKDRFGGTVFHEE